MYHKLVIIAKQTTSGFLLFLNHDLLNEHYPLHIFLLVKQKWNNTVLVD